MLRIAIIDDDLMFMNKLEKKCKIYFHNKDKKVLIKKINPNNITISSDFSEHFEFDLLFLDIEMPWFSGVDLAKKIRQFNKEIFICFITYFSEYALEAYSVHAFDYIIKPINQSIINIFFDDLFKYFIKTEKKVFQSFYTEDGLININVKDILYFEYIERSIEFKNRTVVMNLEGNKRYALNKKISSLYDDLDQKLFVVPHKSFIINLENIKLIKGNMIVMNNDMDIPLSQKRRTSIKKAFTRFLDKKIGIEE